PVLYPPWPRAGEPGWRVSARFTPAPAPGAAFRRTSTRCASGCPRTARTGRWWTSTRSSGWRSTTRHSIWRRAGRRDFHLHAGKLSVDLDAPPRLVLIVVADRSRLAEL